MPTLLRWTYSGSHSEHPAEQRVFAGDHVYVDDEQDVGILASLDGSAASVEFGRSEAKTIKKVCARAVSVG